MSFLFRDSFREARMGIINNPSTAPTATGIIAIASSMTLQEWAWVSGIIGVFVGIWYGWRRDKRETLKLHYELGLKEERRVRLPREEDYP